MKTNASGKPSPPLLLWLTYAFLLLAAFVTLIPFAWLVCASIKSPAIYFESAFLPAGEGFMGVAWDKITLDYFRQLFSGKEFSFARYIVNSVFYASNTAVCATLFSAMGGYALAKFNFRLRKLLTGVVLSSLLVPGSLLLAPGYQLLFHLGLLDSFAGLILPGLTPAFGVFLFRQTMRNSMPLELMEAARMDGCGEIRLFFTIALPMVRPMIGAFLLITFLGCWNNFIGPQIVLQTPDKFPLAVAIAQLKGLYSTNYGMLMAGTMISISPVVCLFLLLQKEFISGLTAGAVKG